ncbi:DUF3986 family protein [Rossellomorea aquimaris]|uniref:DUF3986 family protein n=1 Tax=Rossellomorea aquimaris TaxID=189382 RepID=UPI001CD5B603|nr:DUF3986 family protein [Rossellomorea aquimaris]MCA1060304.1 DUF3986 family protein [Rossellomorea aquimaris]
MIFDDRYHLHVGYYKNQKDLEAIFLKVKDQNIWCMFFENDYYKLNLSKEAYPTIKNFGLMIGIYLIESEDLSVEQGSELFEKFLNDQNIV